MLLKFLILIFVLTSLVMYFSNNAIYTILLLILIAVNIAGILFSLNMEFLGFILIIVYVGAIAILFLFIVMMLQIKVQNIKANNYSYFYLLIIFFLLRIFFDILKMFLTILIIFFFQKIFSLWILLLIFRLSVKHFFRIF